ncbi:MAG: hypothetical protein U0Y82_09795 [Thermoleophilia bacterium]
MPWVAGTLRWPGWAREHATHEGDRVLRAVTDLGSTIGVIVVAVPVAVVVVRLHAQRVGGGVPGGRACGRQLGDHPGEALTGWPRPALTAEVRPHR